MSRHPIWCARGHHCTARQSHGEHRSIPEIWRTDIGSVVATRTRRASDAVEHVEVRISAELAYDDVRAERQAREVIAASYAALRYAVGGVPR